MKNHCRMVLIVLMTVVILGAMLGKSFALTITDTTVDGKFLVTGMPVTPKSGPHALLRISFMDNTAATNVQLCAGTMAQFTADTCGIELSDSGGPGFQFLTLIDDQALAGKQIYVIRASGTVEANFTMVIE